MRDMWTMMTTVAALLAVPAVAQETMPGMAMPAKAACAATPVPPPPELSGWNAMLPVTAATATEGAAGAMLPLGQGVHATLTATGAVTFPVSPSHPGGSASHGGLFAFDVAAAGRYRVAIGSGAWIDVVQGRRALTSVGHAHGAECSDIRKTVDFDLAPGRYLLQVAGNGEATLPLIVVRLPG